jgi:hypothetical protein
MRQSLVAVFVVFAACYPEAPPPRRPISVPEVVPGETMRPHVEEETHHEAVKKHECQTVKWYADGQEHSRLDCNDVATGEVKLVREEHLEVDYAGRTLSRGQIYALGDPDHTKTWRRYDDLRSSCEHHSWPRTLAGGLITGAAIFIPLGSSIVPDDKQRFEVAVGTMVLGGVIYGIGYLTGGGVCFEAHDYGDAHGVIDAERAKFYRDETQAEIRKIVDAFNARQRAAAQ